MTGTRLTTWVVEVPPGARVVAGASVDANETRLPITSRDETSPNSLHADRDGRHR